MIYTELACRIFVEHTHGTYPLAHNEEFDNKIRMVRYISNKNSESNIKAFNLKIRKDF